MAEHAEFGAGGKRVDEKDLMARDDPLVLGYVSQVLIRAMRSIRDELADVLLPETAKNALTNVEDALDHCVYWAEMRHEASSQEEARLCVTSMKEWQDLALSYIAVAEFVLTEQGFFRRFERCAT